MENWTISAVFTEENATRKKIVDRTRDDIVLKFDDYEIVESVFVDSFKPNGLMQSNLLHLVCNLWSRNLDDAIILNEFSVVSNYPSSWIFFMLLFFT